MNEAVASGRMEKTGAKGAAGRERSVSAGRALLSLVLAACAAAGACFLARAAAAAGGLPPWALAGGGLLVFAGLLSVFGWIAGLVRFGGRDRGGRFFDSLLDACGEACLVTDRRGRPVYANAPYRALLEKAGVKRLVGVDNLYAGFPDIAARIYRIALKARDGETAEDEFFIAPGQAAPGGDEHAHVWMKVRAAPMGEEDGTCLWRITDVTGERARQDKAFTNLQHIIDYLDNMPAGLFSTTAEGRIAYLNATLGGWLGLEMEKTMNGSLTLDDIVPEELAARLRAIKPEPGEKRIERLHADLRAAGGETIPV